jgi:hypothetical protein
MTSRGRGGLQQPKNPAAVSNPQSGQRTDGGAGSKSQPLRVPSGGAYGQRQAATQQQQAAPMATGGPESAAPRGTAPPGANARGDVFGPTERPAEMNNAGAGTGENPIARDPQLALRHLMSVMPHPNLERMLAQRREYR